MEEYWKSKYGWGVLTPAAKAENHLFDAALAPFAADVAAIEDELIANTSDEDTFFHSSTPIPGLPYDAQLLARNADGGVTFLRIVQTDGTPLKPVGSVALRAWGYDIHPTHPFLFTTEDRRCGSEDLALYMYDLSTPSEPARLLLDHVGPTCAVSPDGKAVFATSAKGHLSYRSVVHIPLTGGSPTTIYTEIDPRFNLYIQSVGAAGRSATENIVTVEARNARTIQSWKIHTDADDGKISLSDATVRRYNVSSCWVSPHMVLTNAGGEKDYALLAHTATSFRVVFRGSLHHGSIVSVAHMSGDGAGTLGDTWLVTTTRHARSRLWLVIVYATGARWHPVVVPTYADSTTISNNHEFASMLLQSDGQFVYRAPDVPDTVCVVSVSGGLPTTTILRRRLTPASLSIERHVAISQDSTRIPFALIRLAETKPKALLVAGYGAYGISMNMAYPYRWIPLLHRGVAIALTCVRGGREDGDAWYDGGRLHNRHHCQEDFAACIVAAQRRTGAAPATTAVYGRSAGGLLVAATANRFPQIMRLVYTEAPFLDIVNTMSDSKLPLTELEYDEFGDPAHKPSDLKSMQAIAPIQNLPHTGMTFPAVLARSATHDMQVLSSEPSAWISALRARKTPNVLYHVDICQGHFADPPLLRHNIAQDTVVILKACGL